MQLLICYRLRQHCLSFQAIFTSLKALTAIAQCHVKRSPSNNFSPMLFFQATTMWNMNWSFVWETNNGCHQKGSKSLTNTSGIWLLSDSSWKVLEPFGFLMHPPVNTMQDLPHKMCRFLSPDRFWSQYRSAQSLSLGFPSLIFLVYVLKCLWLLNPPLQWHLRI